VLRNQVVIGGTLLEVEPLRHTPAGIALISIKVSHVSEQLEAKIKRRVECEVEAVAFAELAEQIATMRAGQQVNIKGFLAKKNYRNSKLVLHISAIEREKNHATS
jgi:primosomal replication protein N